MNILTEIRRRLSAALAGIAEPTAELLDMVRPSQDPKFGDYQANCAMSLGKTLGQPPRKIAEQIVAKLQIADLCEAPEIAGPGFINLRLLPALLEQQLASVSADPRLGVPAVEQPRTFVIDYSGPNVAKPMHVGHIRSTVIGDALKRVLQYQGHQAIGDNHVGDWGTQFGMILYGYKHFVDNAALAAKPVDELARLYKLVRQLVDYHAAIAELPELQQAVTGRVAEIERLTAETPADPKEAKKHDKLLRQKRESLSEQEETLSSAEKKIQTVSADPSLAKLAREHATIGQAVLAETVKLHHGDAENLQLWQQFLPACRYEIDRIYQRLDVVFDEQLGESYYHDRLGPLVEQLKTRGLAVPGDRGAIVMPLTGFENPMLIQKQDGAFLYATTDLATIQYRLERWQPSEILYVVDHRQSLHFEQLFAAAQQIWPTANVKLLHTKFGTVLGEDGKPFKTRSGDTVGLEGLLDEAIKRALAVVTAHDEKKDQPEFSPEQRTEIARVVGLGAIKYADLCQNRETDYTFSYDKMLAVVGNTAAYVQYAYARVNGIFQRAGGTEILNNTQSPIAITQPLERALLLSCLRFSEALDLVVTDYRPNQLTSYLYELATQFSGFFEACPVLKAESPSALRTRLLLCDLTARIIRQGLELLGISVVEKM
jgi:arginyl-tRNA synthetase